MYHSYCQRNCYFFFISDKRQFVNISNLLRLNWMQCCKRVILACHSDISPFFHKWLGKNNKILCYLMLCTSKLLDLFYSKHYARWSLSCVFFTSPLQKWQGRTMTSVLAWVAAWKINRFHDESMSEHCVTSINLR